MPSKGLTYEFFTEKYLRNKRYDYKTYFRRVAIIIGGKEFNV